MIIWTVLPAVAHFASDIYRAEAEIRRLKGLKGDWERRKKTLEKSGGALENAKNYSEETKKL